MKKISKGRTVAGIAFMTITATLLVACETTPERSAACSPPKGTNLDQAISKTRFDMETGCEGHFDSYFDNLLAIAEGDPKKENKAVFSDFLLWANNEGLLSKRQARQMYSRYFGVKYVSLASDYSVCSQTCPRQDEVMRAMRQELTDKEQGLLKISDDRRTYYRASQLFQESELVLEAACEACGPDE